MVNRVGSKTSKECIQRKDRTVEGVVVQCGEEEDFEIYTTGSIFFYSVIEVS